MEEDFVPFESDRRYLQYNYSKGDEASVELTADAFAYNIVINSIKYKKSPFALVIKVKNEDRQNFKNLMERICEIL